ncbi:Xanthine and CO dehydrogenase maturation factor, XdhC/CoxF family [Roseovarius mucosus DSM 17069]|uniref:Xanthine and CO dehydrogenase maturation factor, XdhC/CoxF family n=1 Tax=Roseovarius mucosus DSM 17069 TaxID=1288298 RepID=A0A0A0HP25_9RHOB|nr:XdhC family protein [Roseovarius mucosus]KGM89015.1 Xanthine and CO dehydrogenase maturation factor, XdhC/CoxF family [Roseovarius mucosus DSM 17069]
MIPDTLNTATHRLNAARTPYAIATVIRTVGATAAKPGARALILADGTITEGWIGGGCVRGAVARAAQSAIAEGTPRLISIQPDEDLTAQGLSPGQRHEGRDIARNGCPSKGAMEIFVEPVLPRPELVILGASPVALALATLAQPFGFDITTPDTLPDSGPLPAANHVRMVVIATQGVGDLDALRAALASDADYIGFVASRRKFATLAARLEATPEALARVHAPAGLAIHAVTPEEIALSILAQIVQHRRQGQRQT